MQQTTIMNQKNQSDLVTSITNNNNSKNSNNNNNLVNSKNKNSETSVLHMTALSVQPKHLPANGKTQAPQPPLSVVNAPDARAKQVLKEAVDAVVNSFAKHTQGYGRGEFEA